MNRPAAWYAWQHAERAEHEVARWRRKLEELNGIAPTLAGAAQTLLEHWEHEAALSREDAAELAKI